ncbi:MAG: pyridoxal-dependent decarboxylase [Pseudomonadota bacterium]
MVALKALLDDVAQRAARYLEAAPERRVAPTQDALNAVESFDSGLAQRGRPASDVLAQLDQIGSPASTVMNGPRYFGFVIGGATPAALAANWLSSAWDQNSGLHATTPVQAKLESIALNWMVELLGLPEGCGGSFVTGATVANFVVLAAGRHRVLADAGWDVEADGLFGAPPITVLISEESHPSVYKSLGLLGLGRERVHRIPVDEQGRMRAEALPVPDGPTLVVTQVGNVNTGACDPVGEICARLDGANAWVHVDGAFGLWASAAPTRRHLTAGMERADSWATDAHKWLNVPYDSGVGFVRDTAALKSAMAISAAYLPTETDHRNPSDYTPELSRRARGVDIWAALSELGRRGVEDLVERCCAHARAFAHGLEGLGYTILNDVVLNQVLVRFGDDGRTQAVIKAVQEDGTCWCGGTVWQGKAAMRISVSNWQTTGDDVARSIAAIHRVASSL